MGNSYTDKIKLRMPAAGDTGWDDEVNDNTQILEVIVAQVLNNNYCISGVTPSDGGGLDVDHAAGVCFINGTKYDISASSKTCTANNLNYLYVDDSGTMQISTTAPTGDYALIAVIDAGAASLDRIGDVRRVVASLQLDSIKLQDQTTDDYNLVIESDSDTDVLSADRTLTIDVHDGDRVIDLQANLTVEGAATVDQDLSQDADVTHNTMTLNGGQIAFPAAQNASADPNTLDDCEKGTWTLTITPETSGTVTMQSGRDLCSYIKIASLVIAYGFVAIDSINSPVGDLLFSLPFASENASEYAGLPSGPLSISNVDFSGDYMTARVENNSSYFKIVENTNGGGWDFIDGSDMDGTGWYSFCVCYLAAN
ncbi:MAG: hypothetical protein JW882_09795 [Deltaproteobacteria bacterium]|nr:hypothetical protein [Deltaproteobacteria bacterium]